MAFLIGVLILILFLIILYFVVVNKIKKFSRNVFGTNDISKIINKEEFINDEVPKSLSSLDTLYLENIKKDFPELNINQLKAMVEENIVECIEAIENKDVGIIKTKSDKIKKYIGSKIDDLKNSSVNYKNVKFHKTVVSKYEKNASVATIYFGTAFEYLYSKDKNEYRKVQDRVITECIYVIDISKVDSKIKSLGLNCPNCGAPIKTLSNKICSYCGSGVANLVTKTFMINNIRND